MSATRRITFSEISLSGTKSGRCPICDKRRTRRKRFWQTINPFNRDAAGQPKTAATIYAELRAEAAAWVPDFTCASHGEVR